MSDLEFDFAVVGAGIVGSWTAKELTKYGKVLLLEQFREPHTRGSSHGQSRLIRSGYSEPFFAELMPHAYRMWRQAETETKEKLIETTGVLCVADSPDNKDFQNCINNMKRLAPENLVKLTAADMKSKYPETLKYDENCGFLLDKSGGIVFAHKAVRTVQQWFQNSGGMFWDCCKVNEIIPLENKILVKTCKNDVYVKSLVVASGAWTKELLHNLLPSLPLQAKAVRVYYWKEKERGVYSASSGFPAVLDFCHPSVYSLPSLEYPGLMKVCVHGGMSCTPEERDKAAVDEKQAHFLKEYIKEHYPLLEAEPSVIETCMYTCTPDEIFLIDKLPGYKNIVIGTGFSENQVLTDCFNLQLSTGHLELHFSVLTMTPTGRYISILILTRMFREPHTRGSSHGQTRLIRSGYSAPFYTEIMPHAFKMWRQAERETKEALIETTGALYFAGSPDNKDLLDCINNMKRFCPENLVEVTIADIKSKYPETLKYSKDCGVILDISGGIIFAHKAVRIIQQLFLNSGGIFWDSCKVNEIIPHRNKILVKTCKKDVHAKSVVVTCGAWTKLLLYNLAPSLPLEVKAVKVYYWKEKNKGVYSASTGFPAIVDLTRPYIYSLPSFEYPGFMKVCIDVGVPCNPDERDKTSADKEQENFLKDYIKEHYPLLETEPAIIENCMYTCAPDEIFLIDTLPGYKNIVIGTGFSGAGFKTSPVVGRLLSELARGVDPFLDITPYRLSRFSDINE